METALLKVVNKLILNVDIGESAILVLLDFSAAFVAVDHSILIDRFKNWVGIYGDCSIVSIGNSVSSSAKLTCGVHSKPWHIISLLCR